MNRARLDRERSAGQALVVLVISVAVLLGGAAVVIDGGNAMAQQRGTQNATDAAALAGALVIAQKMGGASVADSDVVSSMSSAYTTWKRCSK